MAVRIAVNGFGRIGRLVVRALSESRRDDLQIVAINDLGSTNTNAHLLRYDSVHGRFPIPVKIVEGGIDLGQGVIKVSARRDPAQLPWGELDVDIVMECTGIFTDPKKAAAHLDAGAKRVLISAPAKGGDVATIVYGVNHDILSGADKIVSNASCTTNCLAPVAKVLHDGVGIETGFMTTIHSYTSDQPILDSLHSDLYRARAAATSQIPTSTGAAKAVGKVIPALNGKLDGVAIRVPTPNVSCIDLTFLASRATSIEEINDLVIAAADGDLQGVLQVIYEPLVSMDLNHDPASSSFAVDQTKVLSANFVRVLSWYDNEWGFANRMLDTARIMARYL